jgi:hypothetical protein
MFNKIKFHGKKIFNDPVAGNLTFCRQGYLRPDLYWRRHKNQVIHSGLMRMVDRISGISQGAP